MNIALILSGGTGTRLGADIPKQYIDVCEKPIIAYSVEPFLKCVLVDAVIVVAAKEWRGYISEYVCSDKFKGFAEPGQTRQLSIYNGLLALRKTADKDDIVVIHDAARPLVSEELIKNCVDGALQKDGALPVLPMKDTIYFSENNTSVTSLLAREKLFAGQAPEAFQFGKYLDANEALLPEKILQINGSTEPAIIAGMDIAMIAGDENNFKITTKNDLLRFEEVLRNKA